MRKDRITAEFTKLLNENPSLKQFGETLFNEEWVSLEHSRDTWFEPINSSDVTSRLEDLLTDFQELSSVSLENFSLNRDEIEAELKNVDVIAFYESFRRAANSGSNSKWGIYINLTEFFSFNRRIAHISKTSEKDSLQHVWRFIHHHEISHYEIDLAVFLFEIVCGASYFGQKKFIPEAEGLSNGRALTESRILNPWKEVIFNRYAWGNLEGYKEIGSYLSPEERRKGFEKVLEIYLGLGHGRIPNYSNSLMNPKFKFRPNEVPVMLVNNLFQISNLNHAVRSTNSPASSFTILAIKESAKAQKRYEKLAKRNPQMAKQYKNKINQFIEAPDLPGHRIRGFQGEKNLIEARVDGGFRVLLRSIGEGVWEVQDLGVDLYKH